jgi:PAS domain S-box-containing protein
MTQTQNPSTEALLAEVVALREEVARLRQEKAEQELLMEITVEHADDVEEELYDAVETTRRESAEQFELITNTTPVPVIVSRAADDVMVYANESAGELMGVSHTALLGRCVAEFYNDAKDRKRLLATVDEHEGISNWHIQGRREDGVPFWSAAFIRPLTFNSEPCLLEAYYDFTMHKLAEQALRESEERLNLALEGTNAGMWDFYSQSNELYFSPRWFTMLGYEPDELPHTYDTWVDLLHPDDRPRVERIGQRFLDNREGSLINEYRMRAKNGEWRWIRLMGEVVARDADGNIARIVGTHIDITDRRRSEEEREQLLAQIQEQAQRMQQIVDTVPEGLLLLDAGGRVVLANPVAQRDLDVLTGAKVGDVLTHLGNRPLAELLTSPPKGLWHEVTSGHQIFEIIARPMENTSEPEGWVMVINDVTQEREVERRIQQQERLVAVGQLAAGIAHDFNNIMATIVLYAQMAIRVEGLPARVREQMETINRQAQHATRLIQQILDFSRRAVLERRPLDLTPLLKEQIRLLKRTLPENIEVESVYELDECIVNADPTSVQQVVTNLAVNARDTMAEGGKLCIGLRRIQIEEPETAPLPEMQAGEWVQVTVSDTGTGIPPDVLPYIFDPFFTTKAPGKGSGLGLAQVHGIVAQHEGQIDVRTKVGEGTTFIIYLPALTVKKPETTGQTPDALPHGNGQTILVVEDNADTRRALVDSLEVLNYRPLEAANGREALAIFEQHANDPGQKIALVLSDVTMPEMDGQELFHALRQRDPTVKVVLLTGHLLKEKLESLKAQGLNDWMLKPPLLWQLAQVVAQVLDSPD